jgi:hypothetical protein
VVLSLLALLFALGLYANAAQEGQRSVRQWSRAFLALAVGAAAGAAAHGFPDALSEIEQRVVWKTTVYAIGLTSYFMVAGTASAALRRAPASWVGLLALAQFVVFGYWMWGRDDFRYVIYDYVPAMALTALLAWMLWRREREPAGGWILAGVALSLAGAGVQLSGFDLHEYFNHNDLYHVIQMMGLYLFYSGARTMRDR